MAESEAALAEELAPKGLLGKLRAWSSGSKQRNLIIGIGFGVVSIVTVAGWLTMAEIAVAPEEATVERALAALDAGEFEQAKTIIGDLQDTDGLSGEDFGGGLYVLGAAKVEDAKRQWSPERARTDYFVASKYLEEARAIGYPPGREADGLFLLGKSLIESRQLSAGINILNRAIEAGAKGESRAHLLLAEAHFYAPTPDYDQTISEIDKAITDPALKPTRRAEAMLMRAEALTALGRGKEAQGSIEFAVGVADPARLALVQAKSLIAQLERPEAAAKGSLAQQATAALERARRADNLATSITRESDYLSARIAELVGDQDKALGLYDELRRSQGSSPAGIAATLSEAAIRQKSGEDESALDAYRRALDALDDPTGYRSALMPLSEVQLRVRTAHERFLSEGRYRSALQLSERVGRLLGQTTKLEMRADTLRRWGEKELAAAEAMRSRGRKKQREGRRHLREAGITYESLAEARYATRQFTDDLWTAAETLQRGQAYGEAIRVLDRYLRSEPVQRNALALLRLGESHLARGDDDLAVRAFEECLEFHGNDASSFSARLECAKAYRGQGDLERAEELLRHNLTRTALTPISPEWRDSKFELGYVLAEMKKNEEAVAELQDAIKRYENAPQTRDDPAVQNTIRSARYLVGTAHRQAAEEPLERLRSANTVNEKETARAEAHAHLVQALEMYQRVQKEITLLDSDDALDRATLRNCYMLGGDVLFELGRYDEARQAFSNISTLYQNEPYMLEALVQIFHCWRRQQDPPKARGVIEQAQQLLTRLPPDSDFVNSTNMNRTDWERLLTQLSKF